MSIKREVGFLVVLAAAIFIGIAFINATSNSLKEQTETLTSLNESINIASARYGANNINSSVQFSIANAQSVTGKTPFSLVQILNNSGNLITSGNYTFNSVTGTFNITNTTYMVSGNGKGNITLLTYTYKSSNYIDDGGARNTASLILLFAAIAILIYVIVELIKSPSFERLSNIGGAKYAK
jgi:hypothetical protein